MKISVVINVLTSCGCVDGEDDAAVDRVVESPVVGGPDARRLRQQVEAGELVLDVVVNLALYKVRMINEYRYKNTLCKNYSINNFHP